MADHYTLIGGTAREIEGGTVLIGGVLREIESGLVLVNGVAREIEFGSRDPAVFANNSWEDIIFACQNRTVPDTWNVHDQKEMIINGTPYMIDVIGKNHDTYSDGSGIAPLTFQFHDCYVNTLPMNVEATNVGGWASSTMRTVHMPEIKGLMPTAVKNAIKNVNKITTEGNRSTEAKTIADDLFLLSATEVFGPGVSLSAVEEGTQYEYYATGGSCEKNPVGGSASYWWSRTSYRFNTSSFVCQNGDTPTYWTARLTQGVSPGFCF